MRTVGILGGMGPMATADLFIKIIQNTPARSDQEHIPIIIYNNPQIPSRIDAILQHAESPRSELIRSAVFLEQAGADFIAMPCNTAHYWYNDIQQAINIPLINMIDLTVDYIADKYPHAAVSPIMLLATAATVKVGLYQQRFAARGMEILVPTAQEQQIISQAIDAVKAGTINENPYLDALRQFMTDYSQNGVIAFIAGCTEIPLLFAHIAGNFDKIDPTLLLAQEVVRRALSSEHA
ncbi:aspartate racemase [Thermosinus carboxydivorans Nor1]|uniref:Aspartate racemase n=1 Tax=Thermosinus carboxydivorans Nor1 TaxID=401526 RepID=A1HSY7_9FIRM|nr:amino acid racemase [Thermosinus carboxydivorans]EAX46843.1 aspartate racemase [Thermosinus carboxydivorans Nor1]